MGRSQESFSKKEKEKKRKKKRQEKLERREQRKAIKTESGGASFEDMLAYVDENGNLTTTPPDPTKKKKIKVEDIMLGAAPVDRTPMETIRRGRVKFFNDDKGYGFLIDSETKESVFVHINNCPKDEDLRENQEVTFEIEMGPKGPNAVNVKFAVPEPKKVVEKSEIETPNTTEKVEDAANEDATNEDATNEDTANEDATNEDTANEDATNEDTANEDDSAS